MFQPILFSSPIWEHLGHEQFTSGDYDSIPYSDRREKLKYGKEKHFIQDMQVLTALVKTSKSYY